MRCNTEERINCYKRERGDGISIVSSPLGNVSLYSVYLAAVTVRVLPGICNGQHIALASLFIVSEVLSLNVAMNVKQPTDGMERKAEEAFYTKRFLCCSFINQLCPEYNISVIILLRL